MPSIDMKDIRAGTYLSIDGECWVVSEFEHRTPGNKRSFVRTKIKSLSTGRVVEKTIRSGDTVEEAEVEHRRMSHLYADAQGRHFMDQSTYEQMTLSDDLLGDATRYLIEGMEVDVVIFNGSPIGVKMPPNVALKVTATVPGVKGDTVSNVTKEAEVESGVKVQVPLFINEGDIIRVDTRDGSYVARVSTG